MTNLFRVLGPVCGLWLLAVVPLCVITGCGSSGDKTSNDGSTSPDGSSDTSAACPGGGVVGTLSVKIHGAPATGGLVTVNPNPQTAQTVTADMDLSAPAGPYTVTAARVALAGALVRTAYEPSIDSPTPCVRSGQTTTVTVTYTPIATSHRLWLGNAPGAGTLLGYDPAGLGASGAPAATVVADAKGSKGFTFDRAGNVWVLGGTTADPPLARYPAAMFGASGAKTPDVTIDSPSFGDAIPGPNVVAFDSAGNLWVSVVSGDKLVRFTPAQIAASGTPAAAVEITGLSAPAGIAFDATGNLFVASSGDDTVVRFDKAHLAASTASADLRLTAMTPGPTIGTLSAPTGLAFDGAGNLWVTYQGPIVRLTPANLAGTGAQTVTPAVQINPDVLALTEGLAFDEAGGLWVASIMGKFVRLAPTQLAASGNVTPATVISSADVGYAGWFAIYPAPAATPLAHRLPSPLP